MGFPSAVVDSHKAEEKEKVITGDAVISTPLSISSLLFPSGVGKIRIRRFIIGNYFCSKFRLKQAKKRLIAVDRLFV